MCLSASGVAVKCSCPWRIRRDRRIYLSWSLLGRHWSERQWRRRTATPALRMTHADGHAERRAALDLIRRQAPGSTRRLTHGADRGYDSADFVAKLRQACVSPMSPGRRVTPPSTAATPGTRATPTPSSGARRSKSRSAGPRPSAAWSRASRAASTVSTPGSLSPWRQTTSHGRPSCWRPEPEARPTPTSGLGPPLPLPL